MAVQISLFHFQLIEGKLGEYMNYAFFTVHVEKIPFTNLRIKVSEKYLLSGVGYGGSASLPKSNKIHQMEYADNIVYMFECMYVLLCVCFTKACSQTLL